MLNPGGSVKDRIGIAMVAAAEREGKLKPGGTIVEATAGNTGAGLALVAAIKGYRCIFVLPDKMSQEKINLLRAYGAEVVITPTSVPPDSPESYNGTADRLAREIPNAFRPNQFENPNNPRAHYLTTGPEIWEDSGGKVEVFVAGMGTGGTISGTAQFLKEKNPKIIIVGADPQGSILSGDTPKPYKVEGIGEDFIPKTFNRQLVDEMVRVTDEESFLMARRLAREEGILAGGSSGTALAAALKFAQRLDQPKYIVVLLPDTGRNYIDKIYSDRWMMENGFLKQNHAKEAHVQDALFTKKAISSADLRLAQRQPDLRHLADAGIQHLPIARDRGQQDRREHQRRVGHEAASRRHQLQGTEDRGGHGQAPADPGRRRPTSPRPSGSCSPGPPASWSCRTARRRESSPGRISSVSGRSKGEAR